MRYRKDQPIYVQLSDDIKISIINGTYNPGDKLPSIRDYSEQMLVNPNTTQRAYRELEMEGFIEGRTGLGYYVNDDETQISRLKKEYLNEEIDTFIEKMSQLNYSSNEIVEKIKEKL